MNRRISQIALLIKDYDEAIDFYVKKLHFNIVEDTKLDENKRWVLISPGGKNSFSILLAKAEGNRQLESVGNQSGGRVFLFLHTDDFNRDFQNLKKHSIKIIREPVTEPYGTVAVFEDLYGNLWDLIEPA